MTEQERPLDLATQLGGEIGREAGPKLLTAARQTLLESAGKSGTKTSEFKLAMAGLVGAIALMIFGAATEKPEMQDRGIELAKWCIVGYGASRGMAKVGAGLAVKK